MPAVKSAQSVPAPATAPRVTLQRRKPVVWLLSPWLLLLLASPRPRCQIQPRTRLLHIPAHHLLRLQLQLLELLVRVVILLTLHLHSTISNRLLHYITPAATPTTAILLLPSLRSHTVIE
jgi:hypothetical protein